MSKPALDIKALSQDERLDLLDRIWESLSDAPSGVPLTPTQRAELDRRLDEIDREGHSGIPWEEVLARLKNGHS